MRIICVFFCPRKIRNSAKIFAGNCYLEWVDDKTKRIFSKKNFLKNFFLKFSDFRTRFSWFFSFVFRNLFFPYYRFWYGESESLDEKIEIEFLKNFYLGTKTPDFDVFAPKWIFLRNLILIFFFSYSYSSYRNLLKWKKRILKNDWKISRKIGLKVAKIAKIST